jgi:outer membrane protein
MDTIKKTKHKKAVLYLILSLWLTINWSSDTYGQTMLNLQAAFDLLEQQNPDMVQANLNKLLSEQEYKDAKNTLLPRINAGISHNYNLGLAFDQIAGQLVTGNKWSNTANANISLSTTIFQGFNRLNSIRLAQLDVEGEHITIAVKRKALKLELLANYFDVLANMELYDASKRQLELSIKQLHQMKEEYSLGTKTQIDISLTENQKSNDELRMMAAQKNLQTKLLSVKELIGVPLDDSIVLELPQVDADISELSHKRIYHNPEIRMSQFNVDKAEIQLRMKKNAYYPTLSFSSGYGTNYSSERMDPINSGYMPFVDQVNQNRSLYFGISLSIPVLDGFKVRSDIRKANITLSQQKAEQKKTIFIQEKIHRQAIEEYRHALKEHKLYQVQLKSTQTSYEAMKERYALGLTTAMDLAKALLDYNLAELSLIRAKYLIIYNQEVLKILD